MTPADGMEDTLAPEDRPFFEGLEHGELRLPWCATCNGGVWPPRARCPRCYDPVAGQRILSGRGTIYSFSVVHRGEGPMAGREPYLYAYISLDDGPTIPANIVCADPALVRIGAAARLASPAERGDLPGAAFLLAT